MPTAVTFSLREYISWTRGYYAMAPLYIDVPPSDKVEDDGVSDGDNDDDNDDNDGSEGDGQSLW